MLVQCAYIIETIIYLFGESYQYYPRFVNYSIYYDSNIAALASNLLTVPVISTFISTFQLGKLWMILFTILLAGVEFFIRKTSDKRFSTLFILIFMYMSNLRYIPNHPYNVVLKQILPSWMV